ncbi:putative diguanylate cyclase YcdT [Andreesenia angusta]|uniref:Putative diguanylate cyclase YcdT n=1 Tax=Andreesenia angusta TaxID=39480 RepID=A0A1S1V7J3_9FIRM|nr:GGDEF domain-containing protein [Andreesenia angusta]OHW61689.1 putative diguanylate cyclase YcdT [Andreesenia angusta]
MPDRFAMGIHVNMLALAVLALIALNIRRRPDREDYVQKTYWAMVMANTVMILIDIAVDTLNGRDGEALRSLHIGVETAEYALIPLVGMIWTTYVEQRIDRYGKISKMKLALIAAPFAINFAIVIMNLGRGFMFSIDEMNVYSRGEFFWINVVISYIYLVYSFVRIVKNRDSIRRSDYRSLLIFPLLPFLGGILQSLFYGVTLIWTSTAFSLLIVFVNVQNDQLNRDHLTGLYNRRQLDGYLTRHISSAERERLLGGVMIDVDGFKDINDKYGHVEGDKALEYIGEILIRSFRREDFVARYAGDEFMVLSKVEDYGDLERIVGRLKESMDSFNKSNYLPYRISVSVGYDILDKDIYKTSEEFVKHVDKLMYEQKRRIT